jgi:hypothetical protein
MNSGPENPWYTPEQRVKSSEYIRNSERQKRASMEVRGSLEGRESLSGADGTEAEPPKMSRWRNTMQLEMTSDASHVHVMPKIKNYKWNET